MAKEVEQLAVELGGLFACGCRGVEPDAVEDLLCGFSQSAVCRACPHRADTQIRTHQYGFQEAGRWGGSYIYYCPKGLTFCALLSGAGQAGVVFGPVILGELQDLLLEGESEAFRAGAAALSCFSPERMGSFIEVARSAVRGAILGQGRQSDYDQSDFLNVLYGIRAQYPTDDFSYFSRAEEELRALVRNMDQPGAQRLLNELLGRIYLQSYCDLDEVKTRCVELLVVLSRTVTDAGVDMGRLFRFSTDFLRQIRSLQTIDALCEWMSEVLHSFMDAAFRFTGIKHADAVYKTMQYIRTNWRDRPTLDEIARHAYLSKSYLSMLFKQETGIGISEYINRVRIDHSKKLLLETEMSIAAIAAECGFHDQSYYTKVFQKMAGISPKKYRNQRVIGN